ncbi:MAG: alpha/beta fold hydrolase [Pseudomonadota bacterium]
MRLLCLPPAGAGASTFYPLMALDSDDLEVCPIALPGREDRFNEPLPESITALADSLALQLLPLLDRPFALLGYSMGALLACELIERWAQHGRGRPVALFALAARAPQCSYADDDPLHELEGDAFRAALKRLGGLPDELLEHPEVMDLYEPILRADLRNCAMHPRRDQKIDSPVHVFLGRDDVLVSREEADAWRQLTNGAFSLELLDARHILTGDQLLATGNRIRALLSSGVDGAARTAGS